MSIFTNSDILNQILRYIEYKGTKTAYMNDDKKQFLHMDNAGNVVNLSFEESFELLKNL